MSHSILCLGFNSHGRLKLEANQAVDNYWIRANPNLGTTGFSGGINSAILRYSGADDAEPTTNQTTSTSPLVETNLHPSENPGAVSITLSPFLNFTDSMDHTARKPHSRRC